MKLNQAEATFRGLVHIMAVTQNNDEARIWTECGIEDAKAAVKCKTLFS